VFVDIDPISYCIDPLKIETVIGQRLLVKGKVPKAIIPVHFAGLACEMRAILAIADKYGMKVVEDAAHALPATCGGTLIGALGSAATVYSFYATKTITTGEGGMLVTRDPAIAERCRIMRLHGISRDAFDRYTSPKPSWHYEVVAPGYKYNMTDLAASIGIHQLNKAWSFQKRRAEMAAIYDEAFRELPLVTPPHTLAGDIHAWHLYVVQILPDAPVSRDRFIELMAEQGIGCSVHFIPLHLHPYWRNRYDLKPDDFPHALNLYRKAVSLPLYTKMSDEDQERVIKAVSKILGHG
jgi:dTDP-4-amino-4,6-dideoxygalactose transaminase